MAVQSVMSCNRVPDRRELWNRLVEPTRVCASKRLFEMASYVHKVTQRSLKTAKGEGDKSKAGKPPKVHNAIFKRLVMFEVSKVDLVAYVGASLKDNAKKNSQGQTVASLMEEGGQPIDTDESPHWLYKTKVPTSVTDENTMALYFLNMGSAPIGLANTDGSKSSWNKTMRKAKTFVDTKEGREVILQYVRMRTPRQAVHASRFVISLFGFPYPAKAKPYVQTARPFVLPSLKKSEKFIARKMQNLYGK